MRDFYLAPYLESSGTPLSAGQEVIVEGIPFVIHQAEPPTGLFFEGTSLLVKTMDSKRDYQRLVESERQREEALRSQIPRFASVQRRLQFNENEEEEKEAMQPTRRTRGSSRPENEETEEEEENSERNQEVQRNLRILRERAPSDLSLVHSMSSSPIRRPNTLQSENNLAHNEPLRRSYYRRSLSRSEFRNWDIVRGVFSFLLN